MKQGWEIMPFEDSIVKVKYTTKIPSNDYLEQGLYPIVSQEEGLISGYWDNANDVFKVSSPVVIFGDHTRILKYVDFDFVLGADGVKILQPIKGLDAKFFKLYLESCKIPSLGYSRHYKLLKELQVPIPPREEQERIVAELDCLSGVIEKKREQLKQLDALAQSIFYQMFGDIDEVVPLSVYIEGLSAGKSLAGDEECSNKVLKTGAVTYDVFDATQVKNLPLEYAPMPSHKVNAKDVLISRMNTAELVGACAYVWEIDDNIYLPDRLWRAEIKDNSVPIYLWKAITSNKAKEQIRSYASGTSGSMKNISKPSLMKVLIPNAPLSLQQEFAEKIEAIEKQKELIKKSIAETEELFNSRMDYYFN